MSLIKEIFELAEKGSKNKKKRKEVLPFTQQQSMTMEIIYIFFIEHRMKGISESVNQNKLLQSHAYAFLLTRENKDTKYEIDFYDGFILKKDGADDYFFPLIINYATQSGNIEYVKQIKDYVVNQENFKKDLALTKEVSFNWYYEFLLLELQKFYDEYYAVSFHEIIDKNLHKVKI